MWPFGSSWETKPSQLFTNKYLLKKVRRKKCDPLDPVDNLHNYIRIIEISLKKVRRSKCDPLFVLLLMRGVTFLGVALFGANFYYYDTLTYTF